MIAAQTLLVLIHNSAVFERLLDAIGAFGDGPNA
jgi:hypothetical protein